MLKNIFSLILLTTAACSHFEIERGPKYNSSSLIESHPLSAMVWGFVPLNRLPPEQTLCPQAQIEKIDLRLTSHDVMISLVTLGIYIPYGAEITCGKATTH